MRINCRSFHLPKAGNKDEEYEDAFLLQKNEKQRCFGIADGASESLLSKDWARILLEGLQEYDVNYNQSKVLPENFLEQSLEIASTKWKAWKQKYIQERKKPIQWYEEPGLNKGAFSTFLFLKFIDPEPISPENLADPINSATASLPKTVRQPASFDSESTQIGTPENLADPINSATTSLPKTVTQPASFDSESTKEPSPIASSENLAAPLMNSGETSTSKTSQGKWVAVALGDSCLFQVRDNKLIHCFPVSSSAEFTNSPPLVSSNLSPNQYKRAVKKEDDWQKGDKFYLMTDALACWFLHQCEKKNITSELLNNLDSQTDEQFKAWISQLRDNKEIRNDDVTLICIDID